MWYDRFSVKGKRVFLTGAAGGIGIALTRAFLDAGAMVFAVTRRESTNWEGLDSEYNGLFFSIICNLSREDDILRAINTVEEKGGVDVLVNNASTTDKNKMLSYQVETIRKTFQVNFEAAFLLCAAIAPQMAARGKGSIINITSINAERAFPNNPAYVSSKGALRMLTKSLARDFGGQGVRANNICPGYVHTRMTAESYADPIGYEERCSHTMLGRWAEPDDIIGPCLFLASDASAYITGADIVVDGGWLAKGM